VQANESLLVVAQQLADGPDDGSGLATARDSSLAVATVFRARCADPCLSLFGAGPSARAAMHSAATVRHRSGFAGCSGPGLRSTARSVVPVSRSIAVLEPAIPRKALCMGFTCHSLPYPHAACGA
jgi:hypothetical protein